LQYIYFKGIKENKRLEIFVAFSMAPHQQKNYLIKFQLCQIFKNNLLLEISIENRKLLLKTLKREHICIVKIVFVKK
jgi:hypothetical protein